MADFRPEASREGSGRPGRGPGRAIMIVIAAFAIVAVCGAVALFSHGRSANPISTGRLGDLDHPCAGGPAYGKLSRWAGREGPIS